MQHNTKIKVCKPIELLISELVNRGFEIIESKVNDYHFHELYFKLNGQLNNDFESIVIDNISRDTANSFHCTCHWSVVEIHCNK